MTNEELMAALDQLDALDEHVSKDPVWMEKSKHRQNAARGQVEADDTLRERSLGEKVAAMGQGAADVMGLNLADESAGVIHGLGDLANFEKRYTEGRDNQRANSEAAQEAVPGYYGGGNLLGTVGPALIPAGGVAQAASKGFGAAVAQGAKAGALGGGAAGFGEGQGFDDSVEKGAVGAATGAALGGAIGGAARGASALGEAAATRLRGHGGGPTGTGAPTNGPGPLPSAPEPSSGFQPLAALRGEVESILRQPGRGGMLGSALRVGKNAFQSAPAEAGPATRPPASLPQLKEEFGLGNERRLMPGYGPSLDVASPRAPRATASPVPEGDGQYPVVADVWPGGFRPARSDTVVAPRDPHGIDDKANGLAKELFTTPRPGGYQGEPNNHMPSMEWLDEMGIDPRDLDRRWLAAPHGHEDPLPPASDWDKLARFRDETQGPYEPSMRSSPREEPEPISADDNQSLMDMFDDLPPGEPTDVSSRRPVNTSDVVRKPVMALDELREDTANSRPKRKKR